MLDVHAGFEYFINQRANKPAELIAKYIDLVMRGGSRAVGAVNDDEVEAALDRALVLFRYIQVQEGVKDSLVGWIWVGQRAALGGSGNDVALSCALIRVVQQAPIVVLERYSLYLAIFAPQALRP